jgi:hypothetical protein
MPLAVRLRACWVRADNLRLSRDDGPWPGPSLRAMVLESVEVAGPMRRQGVFTRFLRDVCAEPGYDLFVVEAVQNPHLADALMRWGWDFDPGVMDFYWPAGVYAGTAVTG